MDTTSDRRRRDGFLPRFYQRVFDGLLDGPLGEDFEARHIFEDLLKVCNGDGCVEMTMGALRRRLNVPIEVLERCLDKLAQPVEGGESMDYGGRMIEVMEEGMGWKILGYWRYEQVKERAQWAMYSANAFERKKGRRQEAMAREGAAGEAKS